MGCGTSLTSTTTNPSKRELSQSDNSDKIKKHKHGSSPVRSSISGIMSENNNKKNHTKETSGKSSNLGERSSIGDNKNGTVSSNRSNSDANIVIYIKTDGIKAEDDSKNVVNVASLALNDNIYKNDQEITDRDSDMEPEKNINNSADHDPTEQESSSTTKDKLTTNIRYTDSPTGSRKGSQQSPRFDSNVNPSASVESIQSGCEKSQKHHTKVFQESSRAMCELIQPSEIMNLANAAVTKLQLARTLPKGYTLMDLLQRLPNIEDLDVSKNNMRPQAFRAIILGLVNNLEIKSLNISGNLTDTDSARCIGRMLSHNQTLEYLDVSGNSLGKDYFARSVGQALGFNTSLKTLKFESCGTSDVSAFLDSAQRNKTLEHINMSNNSIQNGSEIGFGFGKWLASSICILKCIEIKNCDMTGEGLEMLTEGIEKNNTLESLNIAGNEANSYMSLFQFVLCCIKHHAMVQLVCDNMKVKVMDELVPYDLPSVFEDSPLTSLSLASLKLNDAMLMVFAKRVNPKLVNLRELNLQGNPDLTMYCMTSIQTACTECDKRSRKPCRLEKLSYASNAAEGMPDLLQTGHWPSLQFLNLRKAKISPKNVSLLEPYITRHGTTYLGTLILDGIKLSGSKALEALVEDGHHCTLKSLSLASCSLSDTDLKPLNAGIKNGLILVTLKLSGNRIGDGFVKDMAEALLSRRTHSLEKVDLSENMICCDGATALSHIFKSQEHESHIHTLMLTHNCIGKNGLTQLVKCMKNPPLTKLFVNDQDSLFEEDDLITISYELAQALGFAVGNNDDGIQSNCSLLPKLPDGLLVDLTGLGGIPGPLGALLDSSAILTDYRKTMLPYLSLGEALDLCAYLRDLPICLLSSAEWSEIINEKDAPSWLKISSHREKAVYVAGLPSSVTLSKLEGVLEMDADCNVKEICLMKDILTKQNNGIAWVLMQDSESCDRAIDYYKGGQACLFGQYFTMSRIRVRIDDDTNAEWETKAKKDMEIRFEQRKSEEAQHGTLIQQSAAESKARHEYRLAHPAYADGRIW